MISATAPRRHRVSAARNAIVPSVKSQRLRRWTQRLRCGLPEVCRGLAHCQYGQSQRRLHGTSCGHQTSGLQAPWRKGRTSSSLGGRVSISTPGCSTRACTMLSSVIVSWTGWPFQRNRFFRCGSAVSPSGNPGCAARSRAASDFAQTSAFNVDEVLLFNRLRDEVVCAASEQDLEGSLPASQKPR